MTHNAKKTISLTELAKLCRRSPRYIQKLAREGRVPDSTRSDDGYHRIYYDSPELRKWAKSKASFRKGRLPDKNKKPAFPARSVRAWRQGMRNEKVEEWETKELLNLASSLDEVVRLQKEIEEELEMRMKSAIDAALEHDPVGSLGADEFKPLKPKLAALRGWLRSEIQYGKLQPVVFANSSPGEITIKASRDGASVYPIDRNQIVSIARKLAKTQSDNSREFIDLMRQIASKIEDR